MNKSIFQMANDWLVGNHAGPSTLKGEGTIEDFAFETAYFDAVKINFPVLLTLASSPVNKVIIRTYPNIMEAIWHHSSCENKLLHLEIFEKVVHTRVVEVMLSLPQLRQLSLQSNSVVKANETISVAPDLEIKVSGDSRGRLALTPSKSCKLIAKGDSLLELSGVADCLELKISGDSMLKGFDLHATTANIRVSGDSTCQIAVSQKLEGKVSGDSIVQYKGRPIMDLKKSGGSQVYPTTTLH